MICSVAFTVGTVCSMQAVNVKDKDEVISSIVNLLVSIPKFVCGSQS